MTNARRVGWILFAALLLPDKTFAQASAAAPDVFGFRKWDIGGSYGFLFASNREETPFNGHDSGLVWTLDAGRYVTTHLKADIALMLIRPYRDYDFDLRDSRVTGLPATYALVVSTQTTVRPTSLSGAATYQFRDNEFMHPYVSAGVRMVWQAEHIVRSPQTVTVNRLTYVVAAVDERNISLTARPFVTGGFKSYFNERTFMRSELLWAIGPRGFSHATLRIGAGVDF
jgi:hypothetical protein